MPRDRRGATPRTAGPGPAGAPSWDPYDVWLTRVKQPRDLLPRPVEAFAANAADAGTATDPTLRSLDVLPRAT